MLMTILTWLGYILLAIGAMEILALVIKGFIIGQTTDTWKGGNGCNMFNSPDREPCCTEHDRRYKEGGWIIARWKADWDLLICAMREGAKVFPFIYFFGVRAFGMFSFQYGKKRTVVYPEKPTL